MRHHNVLNTLNYMHVLLRCHQSVLLWWWLRLVYGKSGLLRKAVSKPNFCPRTDTSGFLGRAHFCLGSCWYWILVLAMAFLRILQPHFKLQFSTQFCTSVCCASAQWCSKPNVFVLLVEWVFPSTVRWWHAYSADGNRVQTEDVKMSSDIRF